MIAVTVPWSMPVGTTRRPAFSSDSTTRSGGAVVAMAMSWTERPQMASRTHPPTKRTSAPAVVKAAKTDFVCGAVIHAPGASLPVGARVEGPLFMTVQFM